MKSDDVIFRPVAASDNPVLAVMIRTILEELNVPKVGSTYEDKSLDHMYESFSGEGAAYYVVEYKEQIVGGGGIIHLNDAPDHICELQKMYLSGQVRGMGLGSRLLNSGDCAFLHGDDHRAQQVEWINAPTASVLRSSL